MGVEPGKDLENRWVAIPRGFESLALRTRPKADPRGRGSGEERPRGDATRAQRVPDRLAHDDGSLALRTRSKAACQSVGSSGAGLRCAARICQRSSSCTQVRV